MRERKKNVKQRVGNNGDVVAWWSRAVLNGESVIMRVKGVHW